MILILAWSLFISINLMVLGKFRGKTELFIMVQYTYDVEPVIRDNRMFVTIS